LTCLVVGVRREKQEEQSETLTISSHLNEDYIQSYC